MKINYCDKAGLTIKLDLSETESFLNSQQALQAIWFKEESRNVDLVVSRIDFSALEPSVKPKDYLKNVIGFSAKLLNNIKLALLEKNRVKH